MGAAVVDQAKDQIDGRVQASGDAEQDLALRDIPSLDKESVADFSYPAHEGARRATLLLLANLNRLQKNMRGIGRGRLAVAPQTRMNGGFGETRGDMLDMLGEAVIAALVAPARGHFSGHIAENLAEAMLKLNLRAEIATRFIEAQFGKIGPDAKDVGKTEDRKRRHGQPIGLGARSNIARRGFQGNAAVVSAR